tara:strand:+ start:88 stop:648 length:561 start_codon:yes stop_codon:yes gene_type:complete
MKLNLGCGSNILSSYTNLDKFDYYKPDIVHDLEIFPYPFKNDSVDEVLLSHVLEHIGQDPNVFNNIIKELYRICKHNSIIEIKVPHPRHDDFISDPTHVRPITILGLELYNKDLNLEWESKGAANTPLALIHSVNFKIEKVDYKLEENYSNLLKNGKISKNDILEYMKKYNNVVRETYIKWKVIKN